MKENRYFLLNVAHDFAGIYELKIARDWVDAQLSNEEHYVYFLDTILLGRQLDQLCDILVKQELSLIAELINTIRPVPASISEDTESDDSYSLYDLIVQNEVYLITSSGNIIVDDEEHEVYLFGDRIFMHDVVQHPTYYEIQYFVNKFQLFRNTWHITKTLTIEDLKDFRLTINE